MTATRNLLAAFCALLLALGTPADADTQRRFLTIAAGRPGGVYLPVAEAICAEINRQLAAQGYFCSAEPTPGSLYNLESLARGEADFAIVQADGHYLAYRGEGDWAGKAIPGLRSVLSLHSETFTLLARNDAGITGIGQLQGKRVNIGSIGSGTRASWGILAETLGLEPDDFAELTELGADQAAEKLCAGEIDASFLVIGHPSESVRRVIAECDVALVPIAGPEIAALITAKPYYVPISIPGNLYDLPGRVASFGGRATLVTREDISAEDVAAVAAILIGQSEHLASSQRNLYGLRPDEMVRDSLTAPLHPGAVETYRQLGLLAE